MKVLISHRSTQESTLGILYVDLAGKAIILKLPKIWVFTLYQILSYNIPWKGPNFVQAPVDRTSFPELQPSGCCKKEPMDLFGNNSSTKSVYKMGAYDHILTMCCNPN